MIIYYRYLTFGNLTMQNWHYVYRYLALEFWQFMIVVYFVIIIVYFGFFRVWIWVYRVRDSGQTELRLQVHRIQVIHISGHFTWVFFRSSRIQTIWVLCSFDPSYLLVMLSSDSNHSNFELLSFIFYQVISNWIDFWHPYRSLCEVSGCWS